MPFPTPDSAANPGYEIEAKPLKADPEIMFDAKRRHLEIPKDLEWYTKLRGGDTGEHLCGLLEVDKTVFKEVFRPDPLETQILDNTPGTTLIVKIYEQAYINERYKTLRYKVPVKDKTSAFDYQNQVMRLFENEVRINKMLMKHNWDNLKNPENLVNSPKMIKYGTLHQSGNDNHHSLTARYIAMEKSTVTTKEFDKKFIAAAEEGLKNLHKFLHVAHLNISIDKLGIQEFKNGNYRVWIFDYKYAQIVDQDWKEETYYPKDLKALEDVLKLQKKKRSFFRRIWNT